MAEEFYIIPTDEFERDVKRLVKKYPSLPGDLKKLGKSLAEQPTQGDALGKDCYKVRLLIKSKRTGKSGGGRVITCVRIVAQKIYLLALYDKSEVSTLSDNVISERLQSIVDSA